MCSLTGSHEQAALSASRRATLSSSLAGSRRAAALREWLESLDDPSRSRWASCARSAPTSSGRCATSSGAGRQATRWREHDDAQLVPAEHGLRRERSPVPIERSVLEANMGGDKKPSFQYFQEGHGKTVIAEATLTDDAVRRVLRTTIDDLLELAWAGTHGAVASGMQSVAFTPASAIAAIFAATGQDLGMIGTSSMAHGVGRRVEGGLNVLDPVPRPRGRDGRWRHDAPLRALVARADGLRRRRQGLPLRAGRRRCRARARGQRVRGDGHRRLRELLPRAPRSASGASLKIPPHHDPACWGCGDNPQGIHLPTPAAEGEHLLRGAIRVRRAPPGRAWARARRPRVGRARRGLRARSRRGIGSRP